MHDVDIDQELLDFAYRYPFSKEARELVSGVNDGFNGKYMREGKLRVEEALDKGIVTMKKTNLEYIKYAYLMSYIYARMLISAVGNRGFISKYVDAEAKRSAESLLDSDADVIRISDELNVGLEQKSKEFSIDFTKFLTFLSGPENISLVKQRLSMGKIYLNRKEVATLLTNAIKSEMGKNLPIQQKTLPKQIIECAKEIRLPAVTQTGKTPGSYAWIEKLLVTPIADVRHRTVNLILAPYLMNVKQKNEDEAVALIMEYISRCKEIEPNTNVNSTYVRYQCRYAKSKGLKPLSLTNARELLGDVLNFAGG